MDKNEELEPKYFPALKIMLLAIFAVMSLFFTVLIALGTRLYAMSATVGIICFAHAIICLVIGLVAKKKSGY